jgi:hypothetical protein
MVKTIKITCVDASGKLLSGSWPEVVCCKPEVGDYVMEIGTNYTKRVQKVAHCCVLNSNPPEPYLQLWLGA